ncbi:SLC26A/SulP transporter family protein [Oceanospirillum beijerinckii]|uniref:SLC26A/SulP transporter family protein n=1 Tax=Oceanospirillum beijerinckii TaxID=64976 RepID=UPI0009FCF2FC|nr:SulP family inorganic anion transporter [Oceanospirillum beijerinckii]
MITSALRNLASGVMLGLISTVLSLAFASMIFGTGSFSAFQSGITVMLLTAIIATLVIGWFSSKSGIAAIPLPSAVAMTAALIAEQSVAQDDIRLLMVFGSLLAASIMMAIGQARLGRAIRYLPLPVLTGFLAGVGWLFFSGGLKLVEPQLLSVKAMTSPSLWLVFGFGALLFLAQKKLGGALILPTGFLILVFFFNLLGAGMPEWSGDWFMSGRSQGFFDMKWLPDYTGYSVDSFINLPWSGMLTVALVSVFAMLLQGSALESSGEDISLDHELKASAGANLLTGMLGGTVASLSLSQTAINKKLGGEGKAPIIIAAVILLLICLAGGSFWSYLPLPAVGAVLVYQGMVFMDEWLVESRKRFNQLDYQIIAVIFAVILINGFLTAVLPGTLITILMFVRQHSKLRAIYLNTDIRTLHSQVERPLRHQKALEKYGDRVRVVRLKGSLLFGGAYGLLEELESSLQPPCVFLILDFDKVSDCDSSTASALMRLHTACQQNKVLLLLTAVPLDLKEVLVGSGMSILDDSDDQVRLNTKVLMKNAGQFIDWDRAVEWCEGELLNRLPSNESGEYPLESILRERLDLMPYEVVHLIRYFEPVTVKAGEYFIKQGDNANSMYLITKGKVEIQQELGEGAHKRVKTMMPGTIIGEMGVYTSSTRTTSAIAMEDTQLMKLTERSLLDMEANSQLMAIRVHRFVVMLLADRLDSSRKVAQELL